MSLGTRINLGTGTATGGSLTVVLTTTNPVPAGALIAVAVGTQAAVTVAGVQDSAGNIYTVQDKVAGPGGLNIAWIVNGAALPAGGTITATMSATTSIKMIAGIAISGVGLSPVDSSNNTQQGTGTGPTSNSTAALAQAEEFVLAAVGATGTGSVSIGFTAAGFTTGSGAGNSSASVQICSLISSDTTAKTLAASWTNAVTAWTADIITFKAGALPATGSGDGGLMMHVG